MKKILRKTYSVCPVCLKRIPASHVAYGKEVFLEKTCKDHGDFRTVIWRGLRDMDFWRGELPVIADGENENCPHGCGICSEHRQGTCCVLLEVTRRCNLHCSFCFAEGGEGEDIPFETVYENLKALVVPGQTLVQLSGGEPTVRDDLPRIVAAAKEVGCEYVQLNTNGIRLGEDLSFVRDLAEAGLSFAFMQFDGTNDEICRKLRNRDLLSIKQKAIENCGRYGIGVTLVPTIVPKVNVDDIGNIINYAVSMAPAVRGVHFQPVSYFGRIPSMPKDDERFTLDELLEEIEVQAGDVVRKDSLLPSCCDHPMCGFHGDYIVLENNTLYPLRKFISNSGEISTAEQNRSFVARKWQRPKRDILSNEGFEEKSCTEGDLGTLDGFLRCLGSHSFTITAMAFQDAGNIDLERLRRCSLHVFDDGKHIPFCAYYLTKQR